MNEDRNHDHEPVKRMRTILSSQNEDTNDSPHPEYSFQPGSPLAQLPRRKPPTPTAPATQATPVSDTQPVSRQEAVHTPAPAPASEPPPPDVPSSRRKLNFGPPFWTITGILSLVVNAILIAVLLVMYNMLGQLQGLQGTASNIGSSVLGGLFTNFEKLDRATIKTTIPVDAQIPLDLTVPVQTTTQITLADSVSIPNARVVINTGGLNINSNASVTLPAGTPMMVNLNFNLPVQTTIPVHLDVPVNIPMNQTELHEPFVGLQHVVQPWFCMVEPNASNLDGQSICR